MIPMSYTQVHPPFCPEEESVPETIIETNAPGPYYIKIYIYVIRDSNGDGGQTPEQVSEAIAFLHQDFAEHKIFFLWDCAIRYIDNDNYFDAVTGDVSVFNISSGGYENGIRIFLFPEHPWPIANGIGIAHSSGTALLVSGSYWNPPYISLVRSHIISHEMGHCLGLRHTHNGTQIAYDPDCSYPGDYVCDTPPDPNINGYVSHPSCEYELAIWDSASHHYWVPDEKNIMSYSHPECMEYFTPGQGQRMRDYLASIPPPEIELFYPGDVIISGQQPVEWTLANHPNGADIQGNLIIESAATLTIDEGVEVRFSRSSNVIVNSGGTLNLNGILTSQCAATWKGVEVYGIPSQSQSAVPGSLTPSPQGRIIATGIYSKIENAETGILAGPGPAYGGGVVICNGTTFHNCHIGVRLSPYENKHPIYTWKVLGNQSSFSGCSFITDEFYAFEGDDINKTPYAGLDLDGVRGIDIAGCRFNNSFMPQYTVTDFSDFGYGIYSYNTNFKVHKQCAGIDCTPAPSTFDGYAYGIYTAETPYTPPPGQPNPYARTYTVTEAQFNNCFIGLHQRLATDAVITNNYFQLGFLPIPINGLVNAQIGLILDSKANSFVVEGNKFAGKVESDWTQIGTYASNIGKQNKIIRLNDYQSLTYGNIAFGDNAQPSNTIPRGLFYECNDNISTKEDDFSVLPASSIRQAQGKEVFNSPGIYKAAGNTFASSANYHWDNSGSGIKYYYNDQILEQIPDLLKITSSTVLLEVSDSNTCLSEIADTEFPESVTHIEQVKSEYYQHSALYQTSYSDYQSALAHNNQTVADLKAHEAAYHLLEMDQACGKALRFTLLDTVEHNQDSILLWLGNANSLEGDITLAGVLRSRGADAQAMSLLDNATSKFGLNENQSSDILQVKQLFELINTVQENGFSTEQMEQLESIAENPQYAYSCAFARNLLTQQGRHYPPEIILPQPNEERNNPQPVAPNKLLVYPNPANTQVTFLLPQHNTAVNMSIYDVTGKLIEAFALSSDQNTVEWHTGKVPEGIYFYKLNEEKKSGQNGKLLIKH